MSAFLATGTGVLWAWFFFYLTAIPGADTISISQRKTSGLRLAKCTVFLVDGWSGTQMVLSRYMFLTIFIIVTMLIHIPRYSLSAYVKCGKYQHFLMSGRRRSYS